MTPDPGAVRDRLDGKVAVVTGGASGIGRAVVTRLLSDGAHVAAGDIDADGLGYLTVQAAARRIVDHGSIVTIASLNGVQAARGMAAYCAAKAGVIALTEVAALELGHRGVRANAVAPGLVRTAATEAMWLVPELVADYEETTAVGRHAQPEEIAGVVAFLAGDEASFITGSTQPVDGGAHLNRYPDVFRALGLGPDGRSPAGTGSSGEVEREGSA